MKSTGIIMSGDHPVKIVNGIKTVTRRTAGLNGINKNPDRWTEVHYDEELGYWNFWHVGFVSVKCPYGQAGDQLWVRETWKYLDRNHSRIAYKASMETYTDKIFIRLGNWRPSIHMFKKDSRITLTISDIRPERLQDITIEDAIAEGIGQKPFTAISEFHKLWDSLNAKRGYNWERNPWVWRIKFAAIGVTLT